MAVSLRARQGETLEIPPHLKKVDSGQRHPYSSLRPVTNAVVTRPMTNSSLIWRTPETNPLTVIVRRGKFNPIETYVTESQQPSG